MCKINLNWVQALTASTMLFLVACEPGLTISERTLKTSHAPIYLAAADTGIEGEFIVVFHENADVASMMQKVDSFDNNDDIEVLYTYPNLPGIAARLGESSVGAFSDDPEVAYLEQNQIVDVNLIYGSPADGIDRVDQRIGHNNMYNDHELMGADTHLYVLDTGVRASHEEFRGRVGSGKSLVNDGNGTEDCHGHGTHVASTSLGSLYGMAKEAVVHPVRVLDCGGRGSWASVIAGLNFVQSHCPRGDACVVNMSLGGGYSQAVNDAVADAVDSGIPVVVAAGNDDRDACNVSPASEPKAITVGAINDLDARAWFSNFGECVDLFAPGITILGAGIANDTASVYMNGTSMASPHVAGAVLQYLSAHPEASPTEVAEALERSAGRNCLEDVQGAPNLLLYNGFDDTSYDCQDRPMPPDTCQGFCGGMSEYGCFCDDGCDEFGDCCPDKEEVCG